MAEAIKPAGQYGKQNPLFMYQGTAGVSITAALHSNDAEKNSADGYTAALSQSGDRRCGVTSR